MQELSYLALGDSYTIGEGVAEAERWPVQLVTRLRIAGIQIADPHIIARTGWTTGELIAGIKTADPQGPYHLATLLIGVNNQYRGLAMTDYRHEFRDLLQQAIQLIAGEPGCIVVLSIPDWSVTPFAEGRDRAQIATEIDLFNQINREETVKQGARYVDITPLSRTAVSDPQLITKDGLHPSAKMYAAWVTQVLPVLRL